MFDTYDREGFADDSDDLERLLGRAPATWRDLLVRATT
jgi:hypothetical protein